MIFLHLLQANWSGLGVVLSSNKVRKALLCCLRSWIHVAVSSDLKPRQNHHVSVKWEV